MPASACLATLLFSAIFMTAFHSGASSHSSRLKASLEDSLIGNWNGTSICMIKGSSCRDENVVFHILPGNSGNRYKINADKIVNGQVINMGELDFTLDPPTHSLTCVNSNGTWLLVVNKRHIDGTLTTPEKVVYRKLSLSKAG